MLNGKEAKAFVGTPVIYDESQPDYGDTPMPKATAPRFYSIELDFNFKMMYNSNVYIVIVHYQRKMYGSNAGLFNGGRKKQP